MAYGVKYVFNFRSGNGAGRKIEILKEGYSGESVSRALGQAPVLKKQKNGGICGTSLEFYAECSVDGEYAELYTSSAKEYEVRLYNGGTIIWTGFVNPELYSEPAVAPPYDVDVIATDGIGELKLYDFEAQGTVTLRAMLTYLLGKTSNGTGVSLISQLACTDAGVSAGGFLSGTYINLDYLEDDGKTCYDALSLLMDTLHATITWHRDTWVIARETDAAVSDDGVGYYDAGGAQSYFTDAVKRVGGMRSSTTDMWPVGNMTTKIEPAKKSIVIEAPWHLRTPISNPDMTSEESWTETYASYFTNYSAYYLSFWNDDSLGRRSALAQAINLDGMPQPLTFTVSATGSTADGEDARMVGLNLSYITGGGTFRLCKDDSGNILWIEDGTKDMLYQSVATNSTSANDAASFSVEAPAFTLSDGSSPAGTLYMEIIGARVYIHSASLDVVLPKGYQDTINIDNGARGEGDTTEILAGRITSTADQFKAFLGGVFLTGTGASSALMHKFSDSRFSGLDFMSLTARGYALSVAAPRLRITGDLDVPASLTHLPLVLSNGSVNYWVETSEWDLYEDELTVDALSLPSATLTVESEDLAVITGGSSSSSSSGSSGSGGSGVTVEVVDERIAEYLKDLPPELQSLQSQIDSVSARNSFDELVASSLCVDTVVTSSVHSVAITVPSSNAAGVTAPDGFLRIGDACLWYDKDNGALVVSNASGSAMNFYAMGGVSAGGYGSGGSGGGTTFSILGNSASGYYMDANDSIGKYLGNSAYPVAYAKAVLGWDVATISEIDALFD